MPKSTLIVLIFLSILAALLIGINIGKKLGIKQYLSQNQPLQIQTAPSITLSPSKIPPTQAAAQSGTSLYTDQTCGFSISYRGNYLEQKTENARSTIITDPSYPDQTIVTTCQEEIPKPPLVPEKIEDIIIDGVKTKLYHDASSKDGSPRDEVIVKHPTINHEIIIAGFGPAFNETVASFKFIR